MRPADGELLIEQAHLRQLRCVALLDAYRHSRAVVAAPAGVDERPLVAASRPRTGSGNSCAAPARRPSCGIESGGRRTVWQALLMMKSSRSLGGEQFAAERFHARRVSQIEAVDLEPIAPVGKVRFLRVSRREARGKPRRHDQARARAQKLQASLIPDLHAPACQQRDSSAQIGELAALREVCVAARRAQAIVKVMDRRVHLLADVTAPRIVNLSTLPSVRFAIETWRDVLGNEAARREAVGRREDRLTPKDADAGGLEHTIVAVGFLRRRRANALAIARRARASGSTAAAAAGGSGGARPRRGARAPSGRPLRARGFPSRRANARAALRSRATSFLR